MRRSRRPTHDDLIEAVVIDYRGYRCSITYQEIHNGRSTLQADVGMGRMIPVPRSDVISLIRAEAKRQRREAKRRASLPVEPEDLVSEELTADISTDTTAAPSPTPDNAP